MMKKHLNVHFTLCFLLILPLLGTAQNGKTDTKDEDAFFLRSIFDQALTQSNAYDWLHYLTKKIGARLSGSPQAAAAVTYTQQMLDTLSLDSVWLQPCMVPHWERGAAEEVRVVNSAKMGSLSLHGGLLFGLYPDSQRYFDFHHTDADRFEVINKRELEMGAAAMTALVYLLDKYGL